MENSVRQIAVNFIKSIPESDREKMFTMIKKGITVGIDYAKQNNITAEQLTNELKNIIKE